MNKFKFYIVAAVLASGMTLTSCGDSFLNPDPASKGAAGAAGDPMNINSGLAAAYQILLLDSYAGGSYESSVYIGDIQSDDLWKGGGDAQDGMSGMNLNVSMFTTTGNSEPVRKDVQTVQWDMQAARKGGFKHFMLKEIFEQPKVISDCLAGRVDEEKGMVVLPELDGLPVPSRLRIIACGTSYHAGMWGQHLLENWARMPVVPEIASEFRYRNVILEPDDMVLVISQSGETADTLAALRLAKEKGCIAIALCNVVGSSIPREADAVIYTQAGPEISVASTKAMCSQMVIMALIALYYGQRKGLLDAKTRHEALAALHGLPKQIEDALPAMRETAQMLSPLYASAHSFFYLGRGHAFPLALEGALKLKEISYIHAEGYASGEMKHGPIALIEPEFPTFALAFNDALFPKVKSNIVEVQARRGPVIALANPGADLHVEHLWTIPSAWGPFNAFLALPAMQLFSYEMADYLGKDVDQPRNLAKSVTVE